MPKQQESCSSNSESFDSLSDDLPVKVNVSMISKTFILPNVTSEIFAKLLQLGVNL